MTSKHVWILAVAVALLASAAAAGIGSPSQRLPAVVVTGPSASAEVERIQAHLEAVERELLARDVSHLSAAQRAARANQIRILREYRERGVFPHNHDFPGQLVPYFVDEHGTLCAMAYLISRSGRDDLVERVANSRNNARIPELAGDPELVAWLDEAGLSLEEAARIQPWYGCCVWEPEPEPESGVSARYAVASALTSTVGGVSIGMNVASLRSDDGSRWPGVLGVMAGAAGMALGFDRIGDGSPHAALGAATAGVGVISAASGAWNLFRGPGDRPVPAATPSASASRGHSVSAAPILDPLDRGRLGLLLRLDF